MFGMGAIRRRLRSILPRALLPKDGMVEDRVIDMGRSHSGCRANKTQPAQNE
jgi:hypothetical protein